MNTMHFSTLYESAPSDAEIKANTLPKREEIAPEHKWKLEQLYNDPAAFGNDRQRLKELLQKINQYKDTLQSPDSLAACLRCRDEINTTASRLFAYARMSRDTDAKNTHYQTMTSQMEALIAEAQAVCAYIKPELLTLPEETLSALAATTPDLAPYSFYFENLLRQKKHVLPPREEELLAQASEILNAPSTIFTMLTNADIEFPDTLDESGGKIRLSEGRYNALIKSSNRAVRQEAFMNLFSTYSKYRNTLAATFSSNIKSSVFYAKTKKYSSSIEASLESSNIPVTLYTDLLKTIEQNLPKLHAYIALKKKALSLDEIHMYDLYAPLTQETGDSYAYPDALKLVLESLKPLGNQYLSDLTDGLKNSWVDIYENEGKRTGAYSWGVYGVHPFVLLNYDDRYGSVSTLAHELGHAMHSYYSNKTQPYCNSSYTIFCAEVASTTNEILLLDFMLDHETNPAKRIYFISQYLEQIRTTVYRQAMFAEFEYITHSKADNGEAWTAESLENLWLTLNKKYYGNDIVIDDDIKIEWARIPHFYRPFYVYQYATGYAAATTLAENLKVDATSQEKYLNYLKSGGSDYSLDLLKEAGVDMRQSLPLEITLSKFDKRLAELEKFIKNP